MSEKREKKRRYNLRLEYIKKFADWLAGEPPMWRPGTWFSGNILRASRPQDGRRKDGFDIDTTVSDFSDKSECLFIKSFQTERILKNHLSLSLVSLVTHFRFLL